MSRARLRNATIKNTKLDDDVVGKCGNLRTWQPQDTQNIPGVYNILGASN